MAKLFYDHLILIDEVVAAIELLNLDKNEEESIKREIDELVHQQVLEYVLDWLPEQFHLEFLERVNLVPFTFDHFVYLDHRTGLDFKQELISLGVTIRQELLQLVRRHTGLKHYESHRSHLLKEK